MNDYTLLVMTDGRDEVLHETLRVFRDLASPPARLVIHDDTGFPDHHEMLRYRYDAEVVGGLARRGFGGAVRAAWEYLRQVEPTEFVFHLEDDFLMNREVPIESMQRVLDDNPDVVQMALMRQPWNTAEITAGSIVQVNPTAYRYHESPDGKWMTQRLFFTTNPSVYRSTLLDHEWPQGVQSEGRFGLSLFEDPTVSCGFWGHGESWVTHVGDERVGTGY